MHPIKSTVEPASLLRSSCYKGHFFFVPVKCPYIFLQENPINTATLLIQLKPHSEIPTCIILYNCTLFIQPLSPVTGVFIFPLLMYVLLEVSLF